MQEIKIAKRRRKRLRSTKKDKKQLRNLIKRTLKAIAIVETYQFFQTLQIVPTDQNIQWFYVKREEYFKELLIIFLLKSFFKDNFKYWDDCYLIPFLDIRLFKKTIL